MCPAAGVDGPKSDLRPQRDEIYWTELEFRRLDNLVVQAIQSKNWIGDGPVAGRERKKLRRLIDGMRRKSLRILHRAELYAKSGHAAWPGLDPSVTDPVFMAEAYVKTVEKYENAFGEEERRSKKVMRDRGKEELQDEIKVVDRIDDSDEMEKDLWERDVGSKRDDLLEGDGLRQRRRDGEGGQTTRDEKTAEEDEKMMRQHQPVWDQKISETLSLVGRLKKKTTEIEEQLEKDSQIIDETDRALDSNIAGTGKQRANLAEYSKRSSISTWVAILVVFMCLTLFALILVLTRIPF